VSCPRNNMPFAAGRWLFFKVTMTCSVPGELILIFVEMLRRLSQ
jgi:hypothetical protein